MSFHVKLVFSDTTSLDIVIRETKTRRRRLAIGKVPGDPSITAFRAISKTPKVGLKYLTLFKTLNYLRKFIFVVVSSGCN